MGVDVEPNATSLLIKELKEPMCDRKKTKNIKLDLNCDATTGWRVVYRGEVPHGLRVKEGMKFAWQVIGPQEWKPTFMDSDPWTDYSLYGKLPDADTDLQELPE